MPKIFISYRRDDSAGHTGRIFDRLEGRFGQGQVFMDVDTIRPGLNFVEVVEQAVSVCDGLVAVIGKEWLHASDAHGGRRLEDPAPLSEAELDEGYACYGTEDFRIGIRSFLAKTTPEFQGR